jgi:hypothetical protein
MTVILPIRTVNTLNKREHWAQKAKRARRERRATMWMLGSKPRPELPCVVTFTRISPVNRMDSDGIVSSMKHLRDAVAEWLGVDDGQAAPVTWVYTPHCERGEKGQHAVRVEFS